VHHPNLASSPALSKMARTLLGFGLGFGLGLGLGVVGVG
jgi:hypothetical protein